MQRKAAAPPLFWDPACTTAPVTAAQLKLRLNQLPRPELWSGRYPVMLWVFFSPAE